MKNSAEMTAGPRKSCVPGYWAVKALEALLKNTRCFLPFFLSSGSWEERPEIIEFLKIRPAPGVAGPATGHLLPSAIGNPGNAVWGTGLYQALRDLRAVRDEALEEDFPLPSAGAFRQAERLLRTLYGMYPRRYEVYPTPDGEIAIDTQVPGENGSSVLLLCDSAGGALCLVNLEGAFSRARYTDMGTLPDGFIRAALAALSDTQSPGCSPIPEVDSIPSP